LVGESGLFSLFNSAFSLIDPLFTLVFFKGKVINSMGGAPLSNFLTRNYSGVANETVLARTENRTIDRWFKESPDKIRLDTHTYL